MAITIGSLAEQAAMDLDAAYAENPDLDFEATKAAILISRLPVDPNEEPQPWLSMAAAGMPSDLIVDNADAVYAEMYSRGQAIIQASLDAEEVILQGS